jgi:hypothetical protein
LFQLFVPPCDVEQQKASAWHSWQWEEPENIIHKHQEKHLEWKKHGV